MTTDSHSESGRRAGLKAWNPHRGDEELLVERSISLVSWNDKQNVCLGAPVPFE